jgi:erythromycin esterase-like protein
VSNDLVQFLRDRLLEDEAEARRGYLCAPEIPNYEGWDKSTTAALPPAVAVRALAEVEAKRAILDFVETADGQFHRFTLLDPMARIWRDHPDFEPRWLED